MSKSWRVSVGGKMVDISKYQEIKAHQLWTYTGRVTQVIGMSIESIGPAANIGDICYIKPHGNYEVIKAEVVGFRESHLLLMPLGKLEGIGPGCVVSAYGDKLSVHVDSQLLGQIVDRKSVV